MTNFLRRLLFAIVVIVGASQILFGHLPVQSLASGLGSQTRVDATAAANILKIPGPSVQNHLLGSWSIKAESRSVEERLGSGIGTELWYPGPGGTSLIEELHIVDRNGHPIDAFGPAWWDPKEQVQPYLWCANNLPQGCVVSSNGMRWEGERYVSQQDRKSEGRNIRRQEVFSHITGSSFLQTISTGPAGTKITPTWIARANKLEADLPHMSFAAALVGVPSDGTSAISELIRTLSGAWSIQLTFPPNESMPRGGTGSGEETWRSGPGSLSLIEEYHSTGDDGDVSGLGIFWPGEQPSAMKVLWCDGTNSNGCAVLDGARWESGQLVITTESEHDGKGAVFREVFSDITADSFVQNIYQGESKSEVVRTIAIQATRKKAHEATAPGCTNH